MAESFNTIERIKELCAERDYSYYELAKRSHIPYSTLNTMILKNNAPTLPTLSKLCEGFGISLIQFFQADFEDGALTNGQRECLALFCRLTPEDQTLVLRYMKGMLHEI